MEPEPIRFSLTINYFSSSMEGSYRELKGATHLESVCSSRIHDVAHMRVIFVAKASIARIHFTFVSTFGVSYFFEELPSVLNAFGCFNGPVVAGFSVS